MGVNWILFFSWSSPVKQILSSYLLYFETKVTWEVFLRLPTGPTSSRRSSTHSPCNKVGPYLWWWGYYGILVWCTRLTRTYKDRSVMNTGQLCGILTEVWSTNVPGLREEQVITEHSWLMVRSLWSVDLRQCMFMCLRGNMDVYEGVWQSKCLWFMTKPRMLRLVGVGREIGRGGNLDQLEWLPKLFGLPSRININSSSQVWQRSSMSYILWIKIWTSTNIIRVKQSVASWTYFVSSESLAFWLW
jgi:hypothetical protein